MPTLEQLYTAAEAAGLEEVGDGRRGPCPLCREYVITVRKKDTDDPFLYCGRSYRTWEGGREVSVLCSWSSTGTIMPARRRRRR